MQSSGLKVVAAIPAYNEEKHIAAIVLNALKIVDVVVVCDDGSDDLTGEIAASLGAQVVRHQRNLGYGAAIATLFSKARELNADIMVTLDSDGQHDPRAIRRMIAPIEEGRADLVIGSRFLSEDKGEVPGYRRVGVAAINKVSSKMAIAGLTDSQSGFRAYNKGALNSVAPSEMGMGASTEILSRASEAGLRIVEVPIMVSYGDDSSTHNPAYHGFDVLLSTFKVWSIRHPLVIYGVPGATSLLLAVGFWWWTFSLFAETRKVVTNVALIAVATTVFGLILMAVAVILWVLISVVRER